MEQSNGLIRSSALIIRLASLANRIFGGAVLAGIAASVLLGSRFTAMLVGSETGTGFDEKTSGIRCLMLVGLVMAAAIFVMLQALTRIISSVSAGDAFVVDNAGRLRAIGWSLLIIQLLDVPAALIAHGFPALGSAAPDVGVSPAGWLAVLMTFVLARVFAVGARMRDDLKGTV